MKIRIIKGTNQIGGTITEITSSKGTKILIDFGKDLDTDVTDIPKIDWKEYHAVFITHNHEDHIGLINNIPDDVLVYVEETSLEVYQVFLDFTSKLPLSRKINTFKINEEIKSEKKEKYVKAIPILKNCIELYDKADIKQKNELLSSIIEVIYYKKTNSNGRWDPKARTDFTLEIKLKI